MENEELPKKKDRTEYQRLFFEKHPEKKKQYREKQRVKRKEQRASDVEYRKYINLQSAEWKKEQREKNKGVTQDDGGDVVQTEHTNVTKQSKKKVMQVIYLQNGMRGGFMENVIL
jgi:hypothetical protein